MFRCRQTRSHGRRLLHATVESSGQRALHPAVPRGVGARRPVRHRQHRAVSAALHRGDGGGGVDQERTVSGGSGGEPHPRGCGIRARRVDGHRVRPSHRAVSAGLQPAVAAVPYPAPDTADRVRADCHSLVRPLGSGQAVSGGVGRVLHGVARHPHRCAEGRPRPDPCRPDAGNAAPADAAGDRPAGSAALYRGGSAHRRQHLLLHPGCGRTGGSICRHRLPDRDRAAEFADRAGDGRPRGAWAAVVYRGPAVRRCFGEGHMVAMMALGRRSKAALTLAAPQPVMVSQPNEAAISVSDLSIVFDTARGEVIAVDRVSFNVTHGEFVCIVGPSGCGKSTVLNAIAGLEMPYKGAVTVDGRPMRGPRPDVGMVFQQPHLFPWKSVRRNIAHGPRMLRKSAKDAGAIADGLIEMIGLTRFADAYPHTLSGGMQQRVAIARALANQPRVLLMDEPFGALDAQTRTVMQDNLLALRSRINATVVFVTHDIDEAILLADRVLIMSAGPGRILRDLTVDLPRPRSHAIMLEPAYLALKKDCLDLIRTEGQRAFDQAREH